MTSTTRRFLRAALLVVICGMPLAAQDSSQSAVSIPLRAVVNPASGAEALALNATLTVRSEVQIGADNVRTMSYTFLSEGTAVGQASQAAYDVAGTGPAQSAVDVALPADVPLTVWLTVSRADVSHRFDLLLQGTLDANGKLVNLVVREVFSRP